MTIKNILISLTIALFSNWVYAEQNAALPTPSSDNTINNTFLFYVDGYYSPDNPYAGAIFCMKFNPDGTFYYNDYSKQETMHGKYKYYKKQIASEPIAIFKVNNNDNYKYSMILVSKDSRTGDYIYKQHQDSKTTSEYRLNHARYVILNSKNTCR